MPDRRSVWTSWLANGAARQFEGPWASDVPNPHWKLTLPPLAPSGGGILSLDRKTAPAHASWRRLLTGRVLGAVTESPLLMLPKGVVASVVELDVALRESV